MTGAHDLHIRVMRPDEIALAADWAAAEGWNPGLDDAACFVTVDPDGFFIGEGVRSAGSGVDDQIQRSRFDQIHCVGAALVHLEYRLAR